MNRFFPLGMSLALFAGPAFAQEPTRTTTETKSSQATKDAAQDGDLNAKRQRLRDAEKEARDAQRAAQNAQREAQNIQREVERAIRTQAEKASQARGLTNRSLVRPRSPLTIRAFSSESGQAEPYGLGLAEADAVLRAQLGLPADQGLVVTRVVEKGLADQAGIKLNDVIIKLDGQPVAKVEQARAAIARPGPTFVAVLIREGKPRDVEVSRPQQKTTEGKATTYWIGVPVAPVDAALRSHLAALPDEAGLIATDVIADSPAAKAGVKQNDILFKFADKPIGSQEALVEQVQKSEGKEVKVELLRTGKVQTLTLIPEKRASETVAGKLEDFNLVLDGKSPALFNWYTSLNQADTTSVPGKPGQPVITLMPGLNGRINLGQEIDAQVRKDMKALTEQMEQLRKAIEEMKKALPAAKDPKAGMNFPGSVEEYLTFDVGAFW